MKLIKLPRSYGKEAISRIMWEYGVPLFDAKEALELFGNSKEHIEFYLKNKGLAVSVKINGKQVSTYDYTILMVGKIKG